MKTSELTGAALDWAVAMAENWAGADFEVRPYSTDWAQGGPILSSQLIDRVFNHRSGLWLASTSRDTIHVQQDSSELVAGMRCYVASKLGDDVDVPEEFK